jgi:RNA polymerase sigma-70 factor (ECF subfamily)
MAVVPAQAHGDFAAILTAAKHGDERAWHHLFRLVSGRVVAFLVTRGTPDPEDVAAEVFADVVRSIRRFEGDRHAFLSWTLTIAHRRRVDAVRASVRRLESVGIDEALDRSGSADVEAEVMGLIEAETARRLLQELTPDQADVLALRIYGDLSLPEVARSLDKPLTAVTSLQHRGLEALRRMLAAEGDLRRH